MDVLANLAAAGRARYHGLRRNGGVVMTVPHIRRADRYTPAAPPSARGS